MLVCSHPSPSNSETNALTTRNHISELSRHSFITASALTGLSTSTSVLASHREQHETAGNVQKKSHLNSHTYHLVLAYQIVRIQTNQDGSALTALGFPSTFTQTCHSTEAVQA